MTDETGSPIAGATVEVQYPPPPGRIGAFVATTTNGGGFYELMFDTDRPLNWVGLSNVAAVINSFASGYTSYSHLVPWGASTFTGNLRLRQDRIVRDGDSIAVSIEADSSICSDQEDWFLPNLRCESFSVRVETAGTLTVEARDPGAIVPTVFSATSGAYERQQLEPGTVSLLQVRAGQRYRLFVGVPTSTAPQRYDVSTFVR